MKDPRLAQAAAALDEARTLLVDVVDDNLTAQRWELNQLDASRQFINSALVYIQNAQEKTA